MYIIDVWVTDVDAKSNRSKDPDKKVIAADEREKKKKLLLKQRMRSLSYCTWTGS
jgi:hypothetical protein